MKRFLGIVGASLLLGVLAAAALGLHAWRLLHEPHGEPGVAELAVAPGDNARSIIEDLAARGLVAEPTWTRLYLVYVLGDPPLQAGDYRVELPTTTPEILDLLIRGQVALDPVTVVEGLTLEETAAHLAAAGFGDYETFLDAMRSPAAIADLDPAAVTLEGYLFPDTYHFARSTGAAAIVGALVDTFRRHYTRELAALVGDGDLRRAVILASIVEKEARLDAERPVIAGVYANRLERGIGLYADPTVIYALKQAGTWDGDIRRRDLDLDSPYNTYRHRGLPPGPICSAGLASLRAAARPAAVSYLYFVSRNDGSHVFAETLREHNRNVDEWQRRYWRERQEPGPG